VTPDEFRRVRGQWGLTQQQMADRLGVTRLSIGNWESGKHKVPTVVVKLIDAYRCSDWGSVGSLRAISAAKAK
jgi:DNA-binding XRE family transcriptional regulator